MMKFWYFLLLSGCGVVLNSRAFVLEQPMRKRASFPVVSESRPIARFMSSQDVPPQPEPILTTFREAEVLGLRLMQEEQHEEALKAFEKGLKLPGSKSDVVRSKSLTGPSPVGGSMGGFESKGVQLLDEFEYQAAHYNIACAHAKLGNLDESIANVRKSFEYGFDNYATVRGDPDLDPIKGEADFEQLMDDYEPKGFNPFGFMGKK